jgi:hypothetical protein
VACGAAALRPKKDEGCGPENPELKTRKSHYSTDETGIKQVTTFKRIKILTLTIFTGYLDYQSSQDNPIALKQCRKHLFQFFFDRRLCLTRNQKVIFTYF